MIFAFRLTLTNDKDYDPVIRCIAHTSQHCYVQLISDCFIVTGLHKIDKFIVVCCYEMLWRGPQQMDVMSIIGSSHTSFMHEISSMLSTAEQIFTASIIREHHACNIVKKNCSWLKACLLLTACRSAETGWTGCDWFNQCSTRTTCCLFTRFLG